jgi:hypothetical protein
LRLCASCATPFYGEWRNWSGAGVRHLRTWTGASDSQVRPPDTTSTSSRHRAGYPRHRAGLLATSLPAGVGAGAPGMALQRPESRSSCGRFGRGRRRDVRLVDLSAFSARRFCWPIDRLHSAMFCEELLRKNCPNTHPGKRYEADTMALRQVTDPRPDAGQRVLPGAGSLTGNAHRLASLVSNGEI